MEFQKSRRPQSESPWRRSVTPKHQRRNAQGRFTPDPETEIETTETNQPGASTPMRDTHDLFVPNLFVNSTGEGEIDNSLEIDNNEGSENLEIKTEEINEPGNTDLEITTDKTTVRKSDRNRRRPNYYGAISIIFNHILRMPYLPKAMK